MSDFYHNSHKTEYREPFGAVVKGVPTRLAADALCECECRLQVKFFDTEGRVSFFETETVKEGKRYSCICPNDKAGVWFYRFVFYCGEKTYYLGNNEELLGGEGEVTDYDADRYFQITVTEKKFTVPDWFKKAVIYQIFPDRFAKGLDRTAEDKKNALYYSSWEDLPFYVRKEGTAEIARWDFHRGNLSGVSEKLPYIEALGANLIYLNPIFEARSNHRYDTADYMHVDGLLGGDSAFELLTYVAAKDGVHLMLDGVFSHTGADSIYFDKEQTRGTGAYKNKGSKFRDWYTFKSDDDEEYECWWGVKDLPNVNELSPSYVDFIADGDDSVIRHWIRKGVYGWRLDVADELPDEFIRHLREAADEAGEETGIMPVILGEVWEDASNKVSYDKLRSYFTAKELHTVTNYPFRENLLAFFGGIKTADEIKRIFDSLKENYPEENFNALVNMTGTHDVKRLMTEALEITGGNRAKARKIVKAYATAMFTFPGVPMIYYGDETCLEGGVDPDNRRTFPWGNEDVNMITHFANLSILRKNHLALTEGKTDFISGTNNTFAYTRSSESEKILVILPEKPFSGTLTTLMCVKPFSVWTSENGRFEANSEGVLTVETDGAEVLFCDN